MTDLCKYCLLWSILTVTTFHLVIMVTTLVLNLYYYPNGLAVQKLLTRPRLRTCVQYTGSCMRVCLSSYTTSVFCNNQRSFGEVWHETGGGTFSDISILSSAMVGYQCILSWFGFFHRKIHKNGCTWLPMHLINCFRIWFYIFSNIIDPNW